MAAQSAAAAMSAVTTCALPRYFASSSAVRRQRTARPTRAGLTQRRVVRARGIGFDLGDGSADKSIRPDEEARELIDDAASLLIFQSAMRGETAQAFLVLLTQISMKASSAKVLQAYGNFFRAQIANGSETFLDHILDEVIAGGQNPLASVCARGERAPRQIEITAAAADLELLQRLCVQETTIHSWCRQMAKNATPSRVQPDSWTAAAEELGRGRGRGRGGGEEEGEGVTAAAASSSPSAAAGGGGGEASNTAKTTTEAEAKAGAGTGTGVGAVAGADSILYSAGAGEGSAVLAPASASARRAVRESIAQSWSWAEALPTLMRHWHDHGVEDVAAHSVLTWSLKNGLQGQVNLVDFDDDDDEEARAGAGVRAALGEAWNAPPLPGTEEVRAAVSNAMREHASSSSSSSASSSSFPAQPSHILVHGPPGAGKRWLLRAAAAASFPLGLRCVCVPRGELRALPELLDALRAHPRVRFALLLEMPLCLAPYAEFHNELSSALDGGGGGRWPPNAQLCATALMPTALKPGAEDDGAGGQSLAVRFGLSLALDGNEGGGKR